MKKLMFFLIVALSFPLAAQEIRRSGVQAKIRS